MPLCFARIHHINDSGDGLSEHCYDKKTCVNRDRSSITRESSGNCPSVQPNSETDALLLGPPSFFRT